MSSIATKRQN